jgi:hypothetical protein
MSLDQQIKEWVQLYNQLKILNEKIKEIREKRHGLNNSIILSNTYLTPIILLKLVGIII